MDALDCMHARRSIRVYDTRPVDREAIADILWAAVQAPTPPVSGNEPWAICVIEGGERLEGYGRRALQYAFEHQPADHPWEWTVRPGFRVFWGAPVLVLLCARLGHREAAFDCCRVGQNLLLAAHARGLGSCWVGSPMPWLAVPQVQEELDLPAGFEPSVAIVLGHPAEQPPGNPRPRPKIQWM